MMMQRDVGWFVVTALLAGGAFGCKKGGDAGGGSAAGTGSAAGGSAAGTGAGSAIGSAAGTGAGSATGSAAGPTGPSPGPAGSILVTGLSTPESAIHDAANDVYLVANIDGGPADVDGKGFISRIAPDGKVLAGRWIDSGVNGVTLDAPKGLAITDGTLWVADITKVRRFELATGKPLGDVVVPDAVFLNDLVADKHGGVYVSDMAVDASFQATGKDAVYHIDAAGAVTALAKDAKLGAPNGLAMSPDADFVWVATFGTGEVYAIGPDGQRTGGDKPPTGKLDGLVALVGGVTLVSSWDGKAIYRGSGRGIWDAVVKDVTSPADIGWDDKRERVLIPLFTENTLRIQPLRQ